MNKKKLPYGSWPSPISAGMVSASGTGSSALPRELKADESGVYWIEPRPKEHGRFVIQHRAPDGSINCRTPEGFSVRTRVHEYGGGSYLLWHGSLFFSNEADQRLYRQEPGTAPLSITPATTPGEHLRYADGCMAPDGQSLIYVCEKHGRDGEVHNYLVRIRADGNHEPVVLHAEHDFYAGPRISPDGQWITWLTWDHPRMPWDGTDLWLAKFGAKNLDAAQHLAGGANESILQPEWGQTGEIFYVSDRNGWWNLYKWADGEAQTITSFELEFGQPLWQLGSKTYTLVQDDRIVAFYQDKGVPGLAILNLQDRTIEHVKIEYNYVAPSIALGPDARIWFLAGSPTLFPGLCSFDLETYTIERVFEVRSYAIEQEHFSKPEQIEFRSPDGNLSYAYYYPATHPNYTGIEAERPPLIVMGHGGPTSAARPYLNLEIQYWTSRGFSVVDVDYSGSTGYGRAYRERLRGQWGIADVADCVEAALHLANIDLVDPERLAITGGSAGGYIVLRALTEYDVFSVGASYYGVADIISLANDTHKFESKYDDSLIGPYPEMAEVYRLRSPINAAGNINCPVILFQGMDDKVVPPSQAEIFVKALQQKGIHHKYITFEGEGHGFRLAENIKAALEAELDFYREVLAIF
jgi:dipeptidyl aminopeptidase/acylaminoacyl peptidase